MEHRTDTVIIEHGLFSNHVMFSGAEQSNIYKPTHTSWKRILFFLSERGNFVIRVYPDGNSVKIIATRKDANDE